MIIEMCYTIYICFSAQKSPCPSKMLKPPLRHLPQVAALDVLASDPSASSEGRSLLHQAAGAGHVEAMGDGKGSPMFVMGH